MAVHTHHILLLLCLSHLTTSLGSSSPSFSRIQLPATGCEAYAFGPDSNGPYTGLNDGRIIKFQNSKVGFVEFATTTSNRPKHLCDGTDGNNLTTCLMCGKPLGMEFNRKTGDLYVLDAYRGLMVVGKNGGVATMLAGGRDTHFDFADGIDLDPITGVVYITDLGSILLKTNNMTDILLKANDRTGRLLKYDPKTKRATVILTGLAMPAGVAVSRDGSFVLISEYLTSKITRYWIKGPKAKTTDTFAVLPGNPDNIKRTRSGDFWVAVNIQKLHPELTVFPLGQKLSPTGQILQTINFYDQYNATYITEVREYRGTIYVASINTDFVGVYRKGMVCGN